MNIIQIAVLWYVNIKRKMGQGKVREMSANFKI